MKRNEIRAIIKEVFTAPFEIKFSSTGIWLKPSAGGAYWYTHAQIRGMRT